MTKRQDRKPRWVVIEEAVSKARRRDAVVIKHLRTQNESLAKYAGRLQAKIDQLERLTAQQAEAVRLLKQSLDEAEASLTRAASFQ